MSWPNADTFGPRYEVLHPKTGKPVKIPERGWRWKQSTFNTAAGIEDGLYKDIIERHDGSFTCGGIWFAKDEHTQPSSITFLDDVNYFLLRSILSLKSNGGIEVEDLFQQKNYFSYPKPTLLIKSLIKSISLKNELVLDFFAGSSTTAHAVMDLNAEDNGNRKFVMVQLNESINPDKQKDAYKFCLDNDFEPNIAEISKERIRRAGQKILADNQDKDGIEDLDIGFRVLKIDSTNMKDVYYTPDNYEQATLDNLESHIKDDRTGEDLLFQVMLDWGVPLSLPIEVKDIQGSLVYYVGMDSLVACFDTLTTDLIDEISKDKPLKFVSSELAIAHDQDKTNIKARFAQLSPDTQVKFI